MSTAREGVTAKQLGKRTVGELEDELKARDRRIEELRQEIDELRDLVND